MIDREEEGIMQNNEASLGCLKTKTPYCEYQGGGSCKEGYLEFNNQMSPQPVGLESGYSLKRQNSAPPNLGYCRPFFQHGYGTWPNFYPECYKVRQSQMDTFGNHFYAVNRDYPFPVESRTQYLPVKVFSQGHPHEFQYQEFQYFVVIDFEATCDKEKKPYPQEIIEFPSVLVNSETGQLEASFQTYVRPAYNQLLTDFCKELTGIQQTQVDRGVSLSEALLMHDKWLEEKGIKHKNFAVVTWGNWDCRLMLESECKFKSIRKPPYFDRWINLKVPFQDMFGGVQCNLKEAIQLAGLVWEGRPHCGLDDARNTARLLALLMHWGFKFSITNSLLSQCTSDPISHQPVDPLQQPQKLKEPPGAAAQFHPSMDSTVNERCTYCHCGVMSSKCMIRKPGPMQGRCFFGCGNWTAARRAVCNYFEWASP